MPHRLHWEATPKGYKAGHILEVDFLIDGQLAWVEQNAPYDYGGDGNYLVTSFLTPGQHSFSVRVQGVGGQNTESTVKATVVAAPDPPMGLANTFWKKVITAADLAKCTSGQCGTPGIADWRINSIGWWLHNPENPQDVGQLFDVDYQGNNIVVMRATIEEPPFPNGLGGAFCQEPDPPIAYSYKISADGKTLTLRQAEHDPCGDRVGAVEGTWTRTDH